MNDRAPLRAAIAQWLRACYRRFQALRPRLEAAPWLLGDRARPAAPLTPLAVALTHGPRRLTLELYTAHLRLLLTDDAPAFVTSLATLIGNQLHWNAHHLATGQRRVDAWFAALARDLTAVPPEPDARARCATHVAAHRLAGCCPLPDVPAPLQPVQAFACAFEQRAPRDRPLPLAPPLRALARVDLAHSDAGLALARADGQPPAGTPEDPVHPGWYTAWSGWLHEPPLVRGWDELAQLLDRLNA